MFLLRLAVAECKIAICLGGNRECSFDRQVESEWHAVEDRGCVLPIRCHSPRELFTVQVPPKHHNRQFVGASLAAEALALLELASLKREKFKAEISRSGSRKLPGGSAVYS